MSNHVIWEKVLKWIAENEPSLSLDEAQKLSTVRMVASLFDVHTSVICRLVEDHRKE